MTKITFDTFVLDQKVLLMDGTPAKMPNASQDALSEFTIKEACRRALNAQFVDEQPQPPQTPGISFEKKMERYELSKKIWTSDGKPVELKPEEFVELKKCLGKMFTGEALGFIIETMDKTESKKKLSAK